MKNNITRRRFLTAAGLAAVAAGLPIPKNLPAETAGKSRVAFTSGEDRLAVGKILEPFGGIGKFVKDGSVVVLKPNISFPNPPQWGTTTSPWLVKAVVELCLEAGAKKIIIADNPLGNDPAKNVKVSGIGEAVANLDNVSIMMMSDQRKFIEKSIETEQLKSVETARILDKADVLINLPTAKAHTETGVSFGLKNLMGLIWDRKIFHMNYNLEMAIAELGLYIRPHLTIMDGSRALLNNGPQGPGRVEDIGKIVCGIDPVAVDSYSLTLANYNLRKMTPRQVPHLMFAEKLGLGNSDPGMMEILEV